VILFGRSLGGAVVIELATRPENEHIKAVIVENTFTSVPLIGMSVFPFLAPVIKLLPTFAVKVIFFHRCFVTNFFVEQVSQYRENRQNNHSDAAHLWT